MKKFTKAAATVVLGLGLVTSASFAASHSSVTNKAVAARHAQMQMISYHTGVLGAIAKGEMEYSSEMVDAAATNLRDLAKLNGATMWLPGTEQGAVDGSRAKAEMWSNFPDVVAKLTDLANAADAMIGAADQAAVGAGMGPIGGACKACHEAYRGPKT
jgi:cytochrome c556